MKTLGQFIRERREAQDISLREFAKKLGDLSAAFVSDVELGRRFPSEEVLGRMAHVLGAKVEELKKYDSRPPVEEIKRLSASDPSFGFALRKVVESKVSAKDLLDMISKSEQKKKK
uniref:HTH cro/C1-type domain-containing protein n=1 Tax=mine drainage metagenome TaxID=410659 RepID=E6PXT0_9ZZZZ